MNTINPIKPVRFDICPFCKTQQIEVYSFKGYPQQYSKCIDEYLKGNIPEFKYEIRSMRCRRCGKEFAIDWSGGFPKPLKSSYPVFEFLDEFNRGF